VSVTPVVTTGRKVWLSNTPFAVGGGQTPDALCQAQRPTGVATAVALIARTDRAASSLLTPTTNYVRPDGTLVGTGAELIGNQLESGIWQSADGTYQPNFLVWTGSSQITAMGTSDSTCANWTNPALPAGIQGYEATMASNWWSSLPVSCSTAFFIYCLQTG